MKKIDLDRIISFAIKYKTQLLSALGIVVFSIAFVTYFLIRYHSVKQLTMEQMSIAENLFYSDRYDDALRILDDLLSRHRGEIQARAGYFKGLILYNRKDYLSAKSFFNIAVTMKKPQSILPLAYFGLIRCSENLRERDTVIKLCNEFISEFPQSYLAPEVYATLARHYEIIGSTAEAMQVYDKLLLQYPGSHWSRLAESKLGK